MDEADRGSGIFRRPWIGVVPHLTYLPPLYWFDELQISLPVIILAKDQATFMKYRQRKEFSTYFAPVTTNRSSAFEYDSEDYDILVSSRASDILFALGSGMDIIYTDVDTVWLQDPRPLLTSGVDICRSRCME